MLSIKFLQVFYCMVVVFSGCAFVHGLKDESSSLENNLKLFLQREIQNKLGVESNKAILNEKRAENDPNSIVIGTDNIGTGITIVDTATQKPTEIIITNKYCGVSANPNPPLKRDAINQPISRPICGGCSREVSLLSSLINSTQFMTTNADELVLCFISANHLC